MSQHISLTLVINKGAKDLVLPHHWTVKHALSQLSKIYDFDDNTPYVLKERTRGHLLESDDTLGDVLYNGAVVEVTETPFLKDRDQYR